MRATNGGREHALDHPGLDDPYEVRDLLVSPHHHSAHIVLTGGRGLEYLAHAFGVPAVDDNSGEGLTANASNCGRGFRHAHDLDPCR